MSSSSSIGCAAGAAPAVLEDATCRIEFDAEGGLQRLVNRRLGDECLKGGHPGLMPFRLYADPTREFVISLNDKFQLLFDDPRAITRTFVAPENCRLLDVDHKHGITLRYSGGGFELSLHVALARDAGVSDWSLSVKNTGATAREFLADFPCFDGIRLGTDPSKNLATTMDQGGFIVPAWERPGGVLGESNQLSMQWHAVWDPATKSALSILFMDSEVRPKRLILSEPTLQLHYFPPIRLEPGATYRFPKARVAVYQGDWRPAARAYRRWYDHAYAHLVPPEWFRRSDGEVGAHFYRARRDKKPSYQGGHVIESWRELPRLHLGYPVDAWEYAFYCRTSMLDNDKPFTSRTPTARTSSARTSAARKRCAKASLAYTGSGCTRSSTLTATSSTRTVTCHDPAPASAGRWCTATAREPGRTASRASTTCARDVSNGRINLPRPWPASYARTDADAVRLDSLGFYYLPCYNPEHHHATPFGYNEWLKQLVTKVRKAAVAVKPDVLLLTEGSADWLCPYIHGALTARAPRELSPMRIAVGPYRPYVYACGTLWAALSGFAGAGGGGDMRSPEWNWTCAQDAVHEALVWGDVLDDPAASDPEIVARCFDGNGYLAVVAARPACQEAIWPWGTTIAARSASYTLTLAALAREVGRRRSVRCSNRRMEATSDQAPWR